MDIFGGKLKDTKKKLNQVEQEQNQLRKRYEAVSIDQAALRIQNRYRGNALKVCRQKLQVADEELARARQAQATLEALEHIKAENAALRAKKQEYETTRVELDSAHAATKSMEVLRDTAAESERRALKELERREEEIKELREAALQMQRDMDTARMQRTDAYAKLEAAEKVVAFAKKEAGDWQRFGERTQLELEKQRASNEALSRKLGELQPQVANASLKLGESQHELELLRASKRQTDEQLVPTYEQLGSLRKELEAKERCHKQMEDELEQAREARETERLAYSKEVQHYSTEAANWKEYAKRSQLEMEMYVGRKVAEFRDALGDAQEIQPMLSDKHPTIPGRPLTVQALAGQRMITGT